MSNIFIHPTAIVDMSAKLGHGVWIGPNVTIGRNVVIGPYSCIGGHPEHRDFYPESTWHLEKGVEIADGARLSEMVTVHAGTVEVTYVGAGAAIFQKSHVAHDCYIGPGVTIGGNCSLAGHTHLMEHATMAGNSCTHQRSVMGPYSFLSPGSFLKGHLPPGCLWVGNPARPAGNNVVGLERAGLTPEACQLKYSLRFEQLTKDRKI